MADQRQDRFNFDPQESERQKEQGMARAALNRGQLLDLARLYAFRIARQRGTVTSDDVFAAIVEAGYDPTGLGPAAGCVFRDRRFVFTGEWRKSQRVSNHASDLRVWRLRDSRDEAPAAQPKKPPMREVWHGIESGKNSPLDCPA